MDVSTIITLVWLGVGAVLIGSEFIAPSLVAGFLGAAALVVAGARFIGLESLPLSFVIWIATSAALTAALRGVMKRMLPSEASRDNTDEALAAFGAVVDVLEACDDDHQNGRIRFQGTTWPALTTGERIPAGAKARLVCRDKEGLGWIIEPIAEIEAGSAAAGGSPTEEKK
ncbi:MAG: NfeD family protein [Deltaproteobacteria bacterium]|nr:NfeD family protein [Deltaproteobacteria bacterium]